MRLLSVGNRYPPWSLGGYEQIWGSADRALRRAGHTVRVLTTLPDPSDLPGPAIPEVHRELAWYWREHAFPPLPPSRTVALERHNRRVLLGHLADFRPDAVLWWSMGGMSLSLIAQVARAGVPALGVVGDEWFTYGPRVDRWSAAFAGRWRPAAPAVERVTGIPTRLCLDRAARWAFISEAMRDAAAAEAGWDLARSTVLHPGVDLDRFSPAPSPPFSWRLLIPGRLDPRKGTVTALHALARLPSEARLTLDGAGDARHLEQLRSLAAELGIVDRVTFRRSDPDALPAAYAAADIVLFPVEWREPWGLVPLEAMATGRPVVASAIRGGPAEYLREGDNCLLHPPGDAARLAGAVRELAADAALRRRLIRGGARTAERLTEVAFHGALTAELDRLTAA